MINKVPFTKEGLEKLKTELKRLESVEKPNNIKAIAEARSHGDISENAEYHAAKEKQSFLAGRIAELQSVIAKSEVIAIENGPTDCIVFGRTVLLYNVQTEKEVSYQLVGPYESNPDEGKISVTSPLGQALIGKEEEDEVKAKTPGGVQEYEVIGIR